MDEQSTTTTEGVNAEIRAHMARRRVRQSDLADALGIHQSSVSERMTGKVSWNIDELDRIAGFLDLPITALFPASDLGKTESRCTGQIALALAA